MSATAYQRMRRVNALREESKELGIEGYEQLEEADLRAAIEKALKPPEQGSAQLDEEQIRARAKELGIGNWYNKGLDRLLEEIAEKEGGAE
ncbi:hypothetical protein L1N85_11385 [Paenibacillus alkaliterrae]|uniref:hypothetical protein n=1 Tax=Paenibacillus alkaliterrae TaxID=320909 RepID=UPI001F2008B9|nr:hypothetical protein [Paenibacillus alkaliterrae]MCF2939039.1 hypothetical protein [Paenibacillus alkaliterrae]